MSLKSLWRSAGFVVKSCGVEELGRGSRFQEMIREFPDALRSLQAHLVQSLLIQQEVHHLHRQNSWQSRIRSFFILFPWNFVISCAKMPPILLLASRRSALLAGSKRTCNWLRCAHTDVTSCAHMRSWSLPQWTQKPPCSKWPVE